jgi:hypothetical protein
VRIAPAIPAALRAHRPATATSRVVPCARVVVSYT